MIKSRLMRKVWIDLSRSMWLDQFVVFSYIQLLINFFKVLLLIILLCWCHICHMILFSCYYNFILFQLYRVILRPYSQIIMILFLIIRLYCWMILLQLYSRNILTLLSYYYDCNCNMTVWFILQFYSCNIDFMFVRLYSVGFDIFSFNK